MHDFVERGRTAAVVVTAALALSATGAKAQLSDLRLQTTRGIGVSASVPEALAGIGAWQIFGSSRIGVFAEGKLTVPSLKNDDNYCPAALATCDVPWVEANRNDFRINSDDEWLLLNAGAMYVVAPQFALMVGAGMARKTTYHQYIDDEEEGSVRITWEGNYYVPDEAEWEPQAVASVLMRIGSRVALTFGIESATKGMAVGGYLVF